MVVHFDPEDVVITVSGEPVEQWIRDHAIELIRGERNACDSCCGTRLVRNDGVNLVPAKPGSPITAIGHVVELGQVTRCPKCIRLNDDESKSDED